MGLNAALATASRSLEVFSAGIQVAGQNISNADTPGYIREKLKLETALPSKQGQLVFGTGVSATGIVQQIDLFLETRIHSANSDFRASEARKTIYQQLETAIGELGTNDLSTSLNNFLAAINDVVNQPESGAHRELAIRQGTALADNIGTLRSRIDQLRQDQTVKVQTLSEEANSLIDTIAALNPRISTLEASGLVKSEAAALRTQRYNALNRLSEIVPVRFIERKDRSVDVFSGTDFLILAGTKQHLETVASTDRNVPIVDVQLSETKSVIGTSGKGELAGVLDGRDTVLGGFVDDLDKYTGHVISEFNKIHASGEGLKGFTSLTADTRVTDPTAVLNAAGLSFTPVHGSFQLKVTNSRSGLTQTTSIPVDLDGIGSDTTLTSLQTAIDSVGNISASITADGRLKISADADYEFRFADDTSGALASLGINTFFTGSNSADIGVNAVVTGDPDFFASSQGGGPSDGSNAVALARFSDNAVTALNNTSLDEFYNNTISTVANSSASESAVADGFKAFRESLSNQRKQFSGVSLDEEAVKLLEFQRSYQAAARLISTIDELFGTLLNI